MERHDHITWPQEQLEARLAALNEIDKPWQRSRERMAQIALEKEVIGFELTERYRETKEQEIEEAWHERAGTDN